MRIVCAWCGKNMGWKAEGPEITHGICRRCESELKGYCRGSGNWPKANRRKAQSGPQIQCPFCGRWLREPRGRLRSVPPHKPFKSFVERSANHAG